MKNENVATTRRQFLSHATIVTGAALAVAGIPGGASAKEENVMRITDAPETPSVALDPDAALLATGVAIAEAVRKMELAQDAHTAAEEAYADRREDRPTDPGAAKEWAKRDRALRRSLRLNKLERDQDDATYEVACLAGDAASTRAHTLAGVRYKLTLREHVEDDELLSEIGRDLAAIDGRPLPNHGVKATKRQMESYIAWLDMERRFAGAETYPELGEDAIRYLPVQNRGFHWHLPQRPKMEPPSSRAVAVLATAGVALDDW
jgi:hypothetical protein